MGSSLFLEPWVYPAVDWTGSWGTAWPARPRRCPSKAPITSASSRLVPSRLSSSPKLMQPQLWPLTSHFSGPSPVRLQADPVLLDSPWGHVLRSGVSGECA